MLAGGDSVRLPLVDGGQWAELRDRLSYGAAHDVRVAFVRMESSLEGAADLDIALVRAYVVAWHVIDLEGNTVPLDAPETAPDDVIQKIALTALDIWNANAVTGLPKAGRKRSERTLRALQSG